MSEWVPSMVTEVRLLRLIDDGILPPKEVTGWWATTGDVLPSLWPGETVSFTDFHERGFGIPASDFCWGFF